MLQPQTAEQIIRAKHARKRKEIQEKTVRDGFDNLFENLALLTDEARRFYTELGKLDMNPADRLARLNRIAEEDVKETLDERQVLADRQAEADHFRELSEGR